jgi:probable F420-dependent oxidoreductase
VKIGVASAFAERTPPEHIAATGRIADERGLHSLWVPEHVLFFPEYASRYPYSPDGKLPGNPTGVLDSFVALTYLAAHTHRIRLGTGICLVPQRHPVYTAKQVADLDFLSGGRVDFGIGIGWLREEFEALGIPFGERAPRTRECIAVMKTLWCDEVSHFKGEFYSLPESLQNPKPVQKPHPPIFFGGESDAALRRVAEIGQGWYGYNLLPEQVPERVDRLSGFLGESGRSRNDVEIYVSPNRRTTDPDLIQQYRDADVDQVILPFFGRDIDRLERAADQLAKLQDRR